MKVGLHADPVVHAIPGGVGAYVRRLVTELLAEPGDADIRLLVSRSAASLPDGWPPSAVVRSSLPLRWQYIAWNVLHAPAVTGLDVVHATGLVIPPAPGARLVATIHDDVVERFPRLVPGFWRALYRLGFRTALRTAAVLCANSEATRQRLIDAHRVSSDRVVVTPLAPLVAPGDREDASVLARHRILSPYLLHVGTIEPRKNHPALVRAFAAARLPDHQLVLAGARGWGADATFDTIAASGISERIVVTGRVSDAELAALYARADAFAFPSVYEGFGMPLLEAMAYGVPSVASSDPALCEVASDAALVAEQSDDDALSAAVAAVCTDDGVRARLRDAGRRRAAEYSWARTARTTRDAWARALAVR